MYYAKRNRFQSKCMLFLFVVLNTCVLGFRKGIGIDYPVYEEIFKNILLGRNTAIDYEPGFKFLITVIGKFTQDPKVVFFVFAFLTTVFLTLAIKDTTRPWMLYLFYFAFGYFFNSMNIVRQALALTIVLFAFKYVKTNEFINYSVWIIVASFFHKSAIFLLPAFFLNRQKLSGKAYVFVGVPLFTALFFLRGTIKQIINMSFYRGYLYDSGGYSSLGLYFGLEVLFFSTCIFYLNSIDKCGGVLFIPIYGQKKGIDSGKIVNFLFNMEFIRVLLMSVTSYIPWAFRFNYYFEVFKVYLVCMLLSSIENKRLRMFFRLIVPILYLAYIYLYNIVWGNNAIYPYASIWS